MVAIQRMFYRNECKHIVAQFDYDFENGLISYTGQSSNDNSSCLFWQGELSFGLHLPMCDRTQFTLRFVALRDASNITEQLFLIEAGERRACEAVPSMAVLAVFPPSPANLNSPFI
jgi:hypothetical protein